MDETNKKLAFAIVTYFQSIVNKESGSCCILSNEEQESLEVAIQCIQDVFKIDVENINQKNLFGSEKANLKSIFEVYLQAKKGKKSSTPSSPTDQNEVLESHRKQAEELKLKGNQLVTQQKYEEAIELYSEAIALDPFNPVYLSNRAAAQSQLQQHELAVEDAKLALKLDPTFSKAYSRMGHAYFQLGQYAASADAYTQGLRLDPANTTMQQALAQANKRASSSPQPSSQQNNHGARSGGSGGGGGGGGADFLQMAQQILQNNPALANVAQAFLGKSDPPPPPAAASRGPRRTRAADTMGSGGTPDLSQMMQEPEFQQMVQQAMSDPNIRNNIKNMFGGAGGPGTSGSR